jgi:hypothetical protein
MVLNGKFEHIKSQNKQVSAARIVKNSKVRGDTNPGITKQVLERSVVAYIKSSKCYGYQNNP